MRRSPTIVMAYLIQYKKMSAQQAIDLVIGKRYQVNNEGI